MTELDIVTWKTVKITAVRGQPGFRYGNKNGIGIANQFNDIIQFVYDTPCINVKDIKGTREIFGGLYFNRSVVEEFVKCTFGKLCVKYIGRNGTFYKEWCLGLF